MKREIKFRYIFQNQNGRESIEIISLPELQLFEFSQKFMCECVLSVDQYIERKDKNGKDIFEGDIVSANGTKTIKVKDNSELRLYVNSNIKDEFKTIKEKSLFVCEWNNVFSSFSFTSKTHSINMDVGKRDYKIIGNIHQNKDLIK